MVMDDIRRALDRDPHRDLIRGIVAERTGPDVAIFDEPQTTNPIDVLRWAFEEIRTSKQHLRPRRIVMSAAVIPHLIENFRRNIELAERMLGIGRPAEGKFPNGWPWTLREGRPSREESRLRDGLPGWRKALRDLETTEPASAFDFPVNIVEPLRDQFAQLSKQALCSSIQMPQASYEQWKELCAANRRPSGKNRYQRRASKPWSSRCGR